MNDWQPQIGNECWFPGELTALGPFTVNTVETNNGVTYIGLAELPGSRWPSYNFVRGP